MCAIFGTSNLDRFYQLYEANKQRGTFSFGCAVAHGLHGYTHVFHYLSVIKDNDIERGLKSLEKYRDIRPTYFTGHIQAPTGVDRDGISSIHPFEYGNFVVAHNGVLTNFEELKEKHNYKDHTSNVDSSIIPRLINECSNKKQSNLSNNAIKEALSQLNGTFSNWIWDTKFIDLFIARLSSTLFYKGDEFSSVQVDDMVEVPEKKILWYLNNKFIVTENFDAESHFFTLE